MKKQIIKSSICNGIGLGFGLLGIIVLVSALRISEGTAMAGELKEWDYLGDDEVEIVEMKGSSGSKASGNKAPIKTKYMVEKHKSSGSNQPQVCCVPPPKQVKKSQPAKLQPQTKTVYVKEPYPVREPYPVMVPTPSASSGERNIVHIDQRKVMINKGNPDAERRAAEAENRAAKAEAKAEASAKAKARASRGNCGGDSCGCNKKCGGGCCDKSGLYLGLAAGIAAEPYTEVLDNCIEVKGKEYKPYIGLRMMGIVGESGAAAIGVQLNTNSSAQVDIGFKVN